MIRGMRIAPRIAASFLPLVVVPLAFVSFTAWFAAQDGITAVARSLLAFKLDELSRFAAGQYELLEANDLRDDPAFVEAATRSVANHADGLVRSATEIVFGIDDGGVPVFASGELSTAAAAALGAKLHEPGFHTLEIDGVERVAAARTAPGFGWRLYVTERADVFFAPVERITVQSAVTAGVALVAVLIVIIALSRLITRPIAEVAGAMRAVITDGDLTRRVSSRLNDETGELADTFNVMSASLASAQGEIKRQARNAMIAEKRETKIRTVFQRYVPAHVIKQVFEAPESMLLGEERELSVLLSDIRDFTTFSEMLQPAQVVESLNRYFELMVDVIDANGGITDKYIGDALMAFFGAPARQETAARDAVMTAFQMLGALEEFNEWHVARGRPPFRIGIAINHDKVTVGNIGSERKMDYTVIGDAVNVASRLEGLTKVYRQPILFTESVRRHIRTMYPVRMVDRVRVKGRKRGLAIWTAQPAVGPAEEHGWRAYHAGLLRYFDRAFDEAEEHLSQAAELLPDDYLVRLFLDRARKLVRSPPPRGWDGLSTFSTK